MQTGELMEVAVKAAEILLTSGAEIYRIEDTLTRICASYGVQCESIVIPTGIFISMGGDNTAQTHASVKRIRQRSVDLHRIELVNNFSRGLQQSPLPYKEAMEQLRGIEARSGYSFFLRLLTAGVAAFVFTLLFKGGIGEAVTASLIGLVIYFLKERISEMGFFQFFELFIAGLVAGSAGLLAVLLFPEFNVFKMIIGSMMIFLPGVAITNSIKDALNGDWVACLSRMGEAVFIAAAIGIGVGIALTVGLNWG